MVPDQAPVIPLHLHPEFQARRKIKELKSALLTESLAFVQVALDNAAGSGGAPSRALKILKRACELLDEAREQLLHELLT
jgi:hypothetical protein